MAKNVAAKGAAKKKNRKLRRQIRKTVGALFMVSAIAVAAVPVPDVSAYPLPDSLGRGEEPVKVAVVSTGPDGSGAEGIGNINDKKATKPYNSTIPYAQETWRDTRERRVYTNEDGRFKFVYLRRTAEEQDRVAVILDYTEGTLDDSSLTIPNQLEAYRKISDNDTTDGYCLVSMNDEFIFYRTEVNDPTHYVVIGYPATGGLTVSIDQLSEDDNGYYYLDTTTDPDNPKRYEVRMATRYEYNPCYSSNKKAWEGIDEKALYVRKGNQAPYNYVVAGDDTNNYRIRADVEYIGGEKIEGKPGTTGEWEVKGYITEPKDGVFAGNTNIRNLEVGSNIRGIADYAFFNCGTLNSVSLANGLKTLGNGAFADCRNLTNVTIADDALIDAIGKDAFWNCIALKSFTVPIGVKALGDCAFENCTALEEVIFSPGDSNVYLEALGEHLFRGCSKLIKVDLPQVYEETNLEIDMFEGCTSLQHIRVPNNRVNFVCTHKKPTYPNCEMTWEKFNKTVPESFYFEASINNTELRKTANDNEVTFKFLDEELYEKVVKEHNKGDADNTKNAKVRYQVNDSNELVKFEVYEGVPDIITIPEAVGSHTINSIKGNSFNYNCDLTKVTIPASVVSIGDEAFKGCHTLETVIFTDATKVEMIGAEAFRTQECNKQDTLWKTGDDVKDKPKLYFVGKMMNEDGTDTVPFTYATSGKNRISNDSTEDIWITCHSGWPTNLEVEYSSKEGGAQLVGYPRYDVISQSGWTSELLDIILAYPSDADRDYQAIVNRVASYCQSGSGDIFAEDQEFLAAVQNIAIPTSVDSIKPGLFSGYTYDEDGNEKEVLDENGAKIKPDTVLKSVTINGVEKIEPYTFKGCTGLTSAHVIGSKLIDNYAFDECTALESVTLGPNMENTGRRPFRACTELKEIVCTDSPNFDYNSGMLFRQNGSGKELVECLENRGAIPEVTGPDVISSEELAGVTSIKPEAFQNCKELATVDLSGTTVTIIPERCFKNTDISTIILPSSLKEIEKEAFQDGGAKRLTVTFKGDGNVINWEDDLFKQTSTEPGAKQQDVLFICPKDSNAYRYYKRYPIEEGSYIAWTDKGQEFTVRFWNLPEYPSKDNPIPFGSAQTVLSGEAAKLPEENPTCLNNPELAFRGWDTNQYLNVQKDLDIYPVFGDPEFTVTFIDGFDGTILKIQTVKYGQSATPPTDEEMPKHEGHMFTGWNKEYTNITEDIEIRAIYRDSSGDANRHKVTFYDDDRKTILYEQYVAHEGDAIIPRDPVKEGYIFTGWMPADLTNITSDLSVVATYRQGSGGGSNPNPSGGGGSNPNPSGGNNNNNNNNNNANSSSSPRNSAAPTATPANGNDVVKYTVTVSGGSGTGSYPAGAVVAINAYAMGVGQVFDKWTSSTAGVGFADATATSTTFTMPAANVAITATYKTGGAGNAATNSSGGSGGGGGSSTGTVNNGSTVEVSRPGISNTNVAGATVSGATDNFVVKVSEDQAATDAATAALQARFGDLSRIKYFPMDISLYDSTGRTKIADTSGISVNLTLPLPDELIQYAGNNKMAAISGGALEDLNARFTTVGGVPCINFTATHFSPYVIYVDTANLTEATIDSTPKTGDPIHPKWFLAIGMACISLVLFFKRDKVAVKTKAA